MIVPEFSRLKKTLTVFVIVYFIAGAVWTALPANWYAQSRSAGPGAEIYFVKWGIFFGVTALSIYFLLAAFLKKYFLAARETSGSETPAAAENDSAGKTLQQREIISALSLDPRIAEGDIEAASKMITESCLYLFSIQRASVWLFNNDCSELQCVDLFSSSPTMHRAGLSWSVNDFPHLFTRLESAVYFELQAPISDSRLLDFEKKYLAPNNITSQLFTLVRTGSRNSAVILFECVDNSRKWSQRDISFTGLLASHFSLALERQSLAKAGKALKISEQNYREIFNATQDAIIIHDYLTGAIVDFNEAALLMFGYTKDEFSRLEIADISVQEEGYTGELASQKVREAYTSGAITFEWHTRTKSGTLIWTEVKLSRSQIGGQERVLALVHDISGRKDTELVLRNNESRLRALVSTIDEIVFEFDSKGTYLNIWVEDEGLLVRPATEMLGKSVGDFLAPMESDLFCGVIKRVIDQRVPEVIEYNIPVLAGLRWFQGRFNPIIDPDGAVTKVSFIARDITERKHAEQRLMESEHRLKESQRVARLGHYRLDIKNRGWESSDVLDEILGLLPGTAKNFDTIIELLHPDHRETMRVIFADNVLLARLPLDEEIRIIRQSDKREIWVWALGKLECDEAGMPLFLLGTIQDISERKKVEEALRLSEIRFRELTDLLPQTVFETDLNGNLTYANNIAFKTFGYAPTEVSGLNVLDFIHPEDRPFAIENIAKVQRGQHQGLNEYRAVRKDGSTFPIVIQSVLVFKNSVPVGMRGILIDITDRKNAEAAIREREETLSSLINAMPDIICFKDPQGRWIEANSFDINLFGLQGVDYRGKKDSELAEFSPFYHDAFLTCEDSDEAAWQAGIPCRGDEIIPLPDGTQKTFDIIKLPMFYADGARKGLIVVGRDITQRKLVEEELVRAKEQAEEMNSLKSNFLANMSHELRTPLIGILGFSEILTGLVEDPSQKKMADTIHVAGERLLVTLNMLLNLAKIEANRQEINITTVNIVELVERIVKLFEAAAKNRNLALEFRPAAESILVAADPQMLESVFNNLVSNAVKYTRQGGVTVVIRLAAAGQKNIVEIEVTDSGIGIPADKIDLVFDAFRQASEGYGRAFEGTGLGLTITRRYVELLNGNISVESELHKGSKFKVSLPVTGEIQTPPPAAGEDETGITPPAEKSMTILALDDDDTTLDLIAYMLEDYGKIDCTQKAADTIGLAAKNEYSLLFLDINLGSGMNGINVLARIRDFEHMKTVPAVALTAYAMEGDREEFLASGFDYYLSKPFNRRQMTELMNLILQDMQLKTRN